MGLQQLSARETVAVKNSLTYYCGLFGERFPEFTVFVNVI